MASGESPVNPRAWPESVVTESGHSNAKRYWGEFTSAPDDGGCYICDRFQPNEHGITICMKNGIVPSLPRGGCPNRIRVPGSDDEPFWRSL